MKLIKSEMWDKMQFLFRGFYDRMMHCYLLCEGEINTGALREALLFMVNNVPVLHSSFHYSPVSPYWKEEPFTIRDILSESESENPEKDAMDFLTGVIDYRSNVQIKVSLIKGHGKTALSFRINHMTMDGGDFKYFLKTLFENYEKILDGRRSEMTVKSGSRSFKSVYGKFSPEDRKTAMGLYKNTSPIKDKIYFPWSETDGTEKNMLVRRTFDEETFTKLRQVGKKHGFTVNDAILAALISSLYDVCTVNNSTSIPVSCAIDLRRHIPNGALDTGLTNHTSWMACRAQCNRDSVLELALDMKKITSEYKDDKFIGLYSLPLLNLGFTIFPFVLAEPIVKIGYTNPPLTFSNVGLLDPAVLTPKGTVVTDAFMTGTVKYKPFFQLSMTTYLGRLSVITGIRGNKKDERIAENFFDIFAEKINELASEEI